MPSHCGLARIIPDRSPHGAENIIFSWQDIFFRRISWDCLPESAEQRCRCMNMRIFPEWISFRTRRTNFLPWSNVSVWHTRWGKRMSSPRPMAWPDGILPSKDSGISETGNTHWAWISVASIWRYIPWRAAGRETVLLASATISPGGVKIMWWRIISGGWVPCWKKVLPASSICCCIRRLRHGAWWGPVPMAILCAARNGICRRSTNTDGNIIRCWKSFAIIIWIPIWGMRFCWPGTDL